MYKNLHGKKIITILRLKMTYILVYLLLIKYLKKIITNNSKRISLFCNSYNLIKPQDF